MKRMKNAVATILLFMGTVVYFLGAGSTPTHAGTIESFRVGGWNGNAYTNDTTGTFDTCVAAATYRNGMTLLVQVDSGYRWAIGFSAPHWNSEIGKEVTLQYRIDRGAWQQGTATATAKDLFRMQMPEGGYIITRFRRGRTLYVYDGAYNYDFRLTGTSRLMARMAKCVEVNSARFGATPGSGLGASQPTAPAAAANNPQLAVEATQALFNLMGSAGLSGLKLTPDDKRDTDLKGLHAVASNEARSVIAHIFEAGGYTSTQDLVATIISDAAKSCEGSFSSGSETITETGKTFPTSYSRCVAGDYEKVERAAIVPRRAGGVYVYGVVDTYVGEGGGAPVAPTELTDPDWHHAAASAAD
ncbi:hypothetical protein DYI23_14890 [Roseibium polysiphoniae]|uniref:Uncharacterized protein n=1 Tax=Roseibium polysiphoniae TaxID=2571221 RepID=A0A944CEB1_9HYPH|nr:hypothetical protein [Roseibium polysiphoniae]MBS8261509.1 hypothetical protein [Roseibium polysiphoniae]